MDSEPALCIWGKGLTGKSQGLDSKYPDKTQHWFVQKAPADSPWAMSHPSGGKNWDDFYEEAIVGDSMALSESAIQSGVSKKGSFVGVGSFGVVNLAVHKPTGTRVVFKKVERKGAGLWYYTKSVKHDTFGKFLLLSHPNIVKYVDFMVGLRHMAVVMSPLQGDELDDFIAQHTPVTETFIQSVMKQCISALKYTHENDLIHMDIKNDSFRFERKDARNQGKLVLMDFGLAIQVSQPNRIICGTWIYMAPEVLTRKYGTPVDLWSLGVVFYTLLTGQLPFVVSSDNPEGMVVINDCVRRRALWARDLWRYSSGANGLLAGLLAIDARRRITAKQGLSHGWLHGVPDDLPFTDCLRGTKTAISKEKYDTFKAKSRSSARRVDESSMPAARVAPGCLAGICCCGGGKPARNAGGDSSAR